MAKRLTEITDQVWICEGGVVSFYGFPYPTRSAIVALPDGALWVWSPVALDEELRAEIDGLGRVAHIVSPNKLHHIFLADWKRHYPDARLWGLQSTIRRHPELRFKPALRDVPPVDWQGVIDQAWFTGSVALDELMFCHLPSRTAFVADLIQGFTDEYLQTHWPWWLRALAGLDGVTVHNPGAPRELRLSFLKRGAAVVALKKAIGWNCERVVIAHGQWATSNGSAYLQRAFSWLEPDQRIRTAR